MRLADFIVEQSEPILREWENFARTAKPAASGMTTEELRNHCSIMLASIAEDLLTAQSQEEAIIKSHGLEPRTLQIAAGEEHGTERLASNFTIEQLVSEYRALRSSVLRLWSQANQTFTSTDIDDITRFNEAIDQLLAASMFSFAQASRDAIETERRRKDEFLTMIAHELRNPLSPISAAATILKMAKSDDAVVINATNVIGRQVVHMANLLNDMLDVSRMAHGAVELKLEPLDLRHVINDAVEQVAPQIHAHRHVLTVAELPEPIVMLGDKERLVQIVTNLLTNAAKYTPDMGQIELKLDVYDDQVAISIEDSGVGISPEFLPHVFDMFTQAERTSGRTTGGLGLGLALVKTLTELHDGNVACTSAGLCRGSQFTVSLRRHDTEGQFFERRRTPRSGPRTTENLKILVVDDNVDAADMLSLWLESEGHNVVTTYSGREALNQSKTHAPNVFLLDIRLPDIDGVELARHIRAQPETGDTVLIALTGYGFVEGHERAAAGGFDHHLVKPVDTQKLNRILADIRRSTP